MRAKRLRLVKALYGDTTANKCWDDELSDWLVNTYHFKRCLSSPSIFIKRENGHELVLINAVDDQLYYSTSDEMRKKFEKDLDNKYNVEFMGQVHWYLQSSGSMDPFYGAPSLMTPLDTHILPAIWIQNEVYIS